MTQSKLYYLNQTGQIILHIPENQSMWAQPTTRAQDEQLYSALQAYDPAEVDLLELEPGQYASDFLSASDYRVNPDSLELEFTYPKYYTPSTEKLNFLEFENEALRSKVGVLESENETFKLLLADLALSQGGGL